MKTRLQVVPLSCTSRSGCEVRSFSSSSKSRVRPLLSFVSMVDLSFKICWKRAGYSTWQALLDEFGDEVSVGSMSVADAEETAFNVSN